MSTGALTRRGLLLAVTAVSLYLLAPALIGVFGAFDELDEISPLWFVAMVALQVGSFACAWGILRLAVRTDRWRPVILSQLAANSFGRVVPGGAATVGAVQYSMLVRAGVPSAAAASGITASALVVFATLLALPMLALPAILTGVTVDPTLAKAALAGAIVVRPHGRARRGLRDLGPAARADRPRGAGASQPAAAEAPADHGAPERLLHERDVVVGVLGAKWWEALLLAAGRWVLDYLTLISALYAVGATPRASLVLLAFCAAQLLGNVPLTPGGLGFVEAGLTGMLALAGVGPGAAVVATLGYRLVSFWLPIPAGAVAAVMHRHRYGSEEVEPPPTPKPEPDASSAGSSGGPFCSHQALIAAMAGPMIRFFWKFSVSLTLGSGCSGTGTSRNSHSGSQPSLGSQTSRRSAGTVSITDWFQRSIASAIGPGSPFVPAHAPRSSPQFISVRRSIKAAQAGSTWYWARTRWCMSVSPKKIWVIVSPCCAPRNRHRARSAAPSASG